MRVNIMPVVRFQFPPDHPQFLPPAHLRLYALLMFPEDIEKQRKYFEAVVLELSDTQDRRIAEFLPFIQKQMLNKAVRPLGGNGPEIHPLWVSAMNLHGVIYANAHDIPIGVLRIREVLSKMLVANRIRADEKTLQRIWNRRRDVAHLDAAYYFCRVFLKFGGPAFLGETVEQFQFMLTLAHELGEAGCSIVPKGAREPLLLKASIWQIPPEMLCRWELYSVPEVHAANCAAAEFLRRHAPRAS
jgi:hypothetical protein